MILAAYIGWPDPRQPDPKVQSRWPRWPTSNSAELHQKYYISITINVAVDSTYLERCTCKTVNQVQTADDW